MFDPMVAEDRPHALVEETPELRFEALEAVMCGICPFEGFLLGLSIGCWARIATKKRRRDGRKAGQCRALLKRGRREVGQPRIEPAVHVERGSGRDIGEDRLGPIDRKPPVAQVNP